MLHHASSVLGTERKRRHDDARHTCWVQLKECGGHSFKNRIDLARRLADVITVGPRELPVTPLLVKLFVERALERAKPSSKPDLDDPPRSVPEVYFDYLRGLNPDDPSADNYLSDDVMMEAVKLIARVELR